MGDPSSDHDYRVWLLTWTTYGTWLPGDERGFVSKVRDAASHPVIHNQPGTPFDKDQPHLARFAQTLVSGPPVQLSKHHAREITSQFHDVVRFRGHRLLALAILRSHIHLVVAVAGDPNPADVLRDFKSYASRRLNREFGRPVSKTWWSRSGSRRKLPDENAVCAAIQYVLNQRGALMTWSFDDLKREPEP